jgi:hypothetical protein
MRAKPNGPVHVASESAASSIDDELALLFRARRLVSRDAPKALLLLREHAERFPRGPFQEEREALSIEALVAAGDGEAATRRYAEFRRRHPRSAYGTRLSTLLPAVALDSARAE